VLDTARHAERFHACFAGFGIPGLMTHATLRLSRAPEAYSLRTLAVANLVEAAEVLLTHAGAPLLYGWHDGRPGAFGRGVIRYGLEAQDAPAAQRRSARDLPLAIQPWPVCAWNRAGIGAMNAWIRSQYARGGQNHVDVGKALFPLNDARSYFAGFGREGFIEAQWLVPHERFAEFAYALQAEVTRRRPRISLIASKLFDGVAEGLSFDGRGVALAIQMPQPKHPSQAAFIEALTALALDHGARPNLIKDSTLQADAARRGIAGFDIARERLRAFDPRGLQRSELTRRLGL
jgi:decaprenylphospho-beta-D-ribofuranose 2-oxidase